MRHLAQDDSVITMSGECLDVSWTSRQSLLFVGVIAYVLTSVTCKVVIFSSTAWSTKSFFLVLRVIIWLHLSNQNADSASSPFAHLPVRPSVRPTVRPLPCPNIPATACPPSTRPAVHPPDRVFVGLPSICPYTSPGICPSNPGHSPVSQSVIMFPRLFARLSPRLPVSISTILFLHRPACLSPLPRPPYQRPRSQHKHVYVLISHTCSRFTRNVVVINLPPTEIVARIRGNTEAQIIILITCLD